MVENDGCVGLWCRMVAAQCQEVYNHPWEQSYLGGIYYVTLQQPYSIGWIQRDRITNWVGFKHRRMDGKERRVVSTGHGG